MWYVILFPKENSVSIVPSSWYIERSNECFWPPENMKQFDIDKLVKYKHVPDENWNPHKANILGKYSDYKIAREKLRKAKKNDKLSSTDGEKVGRGKRKRTKQFRYSSPSDTSSGREEDTSDNSFTYPNPDFLNKTTTPTTNYNQEKIFENTYQDLYLPKVTQGEKFRIDRLLDNETLPNENNKAAIENDKDDRKFDSIILKLEKIQYDNSEFRVEVMRRLNLINMKLNDLEESVKKIVQIKRMTEL
ncbi:hypothetical protein FQR65_LT17458 [Abscondita terminalis]|nr:hypothetical protein FQR65_LT17458 [Abscondita terminalis]